MNGGITNPAVERYLYAMLPERDDVLREMEAEAEQRKIPIVGPAVGRLFYTLGLAMRVQTVFEMGSAIGYSTIWWARAVGPGGRVVYTDGSRKNADEARRNFERAGVADRISIRVGDALEILSEEKSAAYDVIFNDVDKEDYPRVLKLAAPRVRKGGVFITDNVLWRGQVAEASALEDNTVSEPRVQAIVTFNRQLCQMKEFSTSILPLRDGVAIAVKL